MIIMSEKEKRSMPQSTAGLIRYYDVEETGIKLKPIHIIAMSLFFVFFVLALKFLA